MLKVALLYSTLNYLGARKEFNLSLEIVLLNSRLYWPDPADLSIVLNLDRCYINLLIQRQVDKYRYRAKRQDMGL